jgi:3D (Asp-Asp-Asp) domain-containing protein
VRIQPARESGVRAARRLAHATGLNVTKLGRKVNLCAAAVAVAMMGMSPTAYAEHLAPAQSLPAADQSEVLPAATECTVPTGGTQTNFDGKAQLIPAAELDGPCPQHQAAPAVQTAPDAADGEDQPAGKAFGLKATLYITTDRDSGRDSIGCNVVPMRTVAVDGRIVKRHSVLFIKETVGLKMPDGTVHDGYWYATDVGSAIHPGRIDLYTGKGIATIKPLMHLNLKTLTVTHVGQFSGCPKAAGAPVQLASS